MAANRFVKYCPQCGAENPARASLCQGCFKGDLTRAVAEPPRSAANTVTADAASDVAAVAAETETEVPRHGTARVADLRPDVATLRLELVEDPAVSFVVHDGETVGRTAKADVVLTGVPQADYIHGAHARLYRRGSQWFVQYLGGFNYIRVDGQEFRSDDEVALHDGSTLVLSLTAFHVRIEGSS
jgi:ribosomal protein L40E